MSDWKVTLSALSDRYDIITEIGKGTYGEVYKCLDKQTGQVVALKKINILDDKEGFPQTTIREIDLLSRLHHENIVSLRAIVTTFPQDYGLSGNSHVYLVFEYCEFDLYGLLYAYTEPILTPLHIVSYIKQLLVAVKVCHDNAIVHRDLKPANLFVTRKNVVKLGDFGLARRIVRECSTAVARRRPQTADCRTPIGSRLSAPSQSADPDRFFDPVQYRCVPQYTKDHIGRQWRPKALPAPDTGPLRRPRNRFLPVRCRWKNRCSCRAR